MLYAFQVDEEKFPVQLLQTSWLSMVANRFWSTFSEVQTAIADWRPADK